MNMREGGRRMTRRNSSFVADGPAQASEASMSTPTILNGSRDPRLVRKRAARACDQCRRRKSRCDGQMDCSACKVVGLQCSYGHTVKQARGPSYVAHLEKKVTDLEDRIRRASIVSEASATGALSASQSPHLATNLVESQTTSSFGLGSLPLTAPSTQKSHSYSSQGSLSSSSWSNAQPTTAEAACLNTITSEPRGKAFGIDILRQLWNFCNQISSPPLSNRPEASIKLVQALDAPLPVDSMSAVGGSPLLPTKTHLIHWISIAFNEAFHLWPFVDKEYVDKIVYRIYNTNNFGQEESDRDDLALLYAVLALGQRFDASVNVNAQERRTQGLPYFAAAKDIVPLTNCDRSLTAIQTVLCMALYLKAGSAQMRVHAYVSAAASAALRMGLHEHVPCFPEQELAARRRLWSTICVLDAFVSSSLGIPRTVSICDSGEPDWASALAFSKTDEEMLIAAAHVHLVSILGRAVDKTYCGPRARSSTGVGSFSIPPTAMREVCDELDGWKLGCATLSTPVENMRTSQLLLSYSHAYVQLLLFTPFAHHLGWTNATLSEYEYGIRAFNAALHAVRVAGVLQKSLNLNEAYFSTVDVLAFAAMTLLVVELGCNNSSMLAEAMKAGKRAKELLLVLSLQSHTAAECWEAISPAQQAGKGSAAPRPLTTRWPPNLLPADSGIADLGDVNMDSSLDAFFQLGGTPAGSINLAALAA